MKQHHCFDSVVHGFAWQLPYGGAAAVNTDAACPCMAMDINLGAGMAAPIHSGELGVWIIRYDGYVSGHDR